jgi:hypothetical protein
MADGIRATPYRYATAGAANDIIGGLLGYLRDPRRTQQMQGLAGLLESTGIPKTVERLAYGEPLTNLQQANVPTLRPETAEALLTLLPVPSGASRAVRAADPLVQKYGPRLETAMEPMLASAYNRGGLSREMVEAMGNQTVSPLTVYQGSPAKFNRLDATKIGSGEGAQSYGYGHYTAEAKPVAVDYQKRLAKENFTQDLNSKMALVDVNGKQLTEFNVDVNSDLIDAAKAGKQQFIDLADTKKARWEELSNDAEYPFKDYAKQKVASYTSLLDEAKKGGVDYTGSGFLYEMDLPDEQIAKMLDWDKPLSKQPKEVKDAMARLGITVDEKKVAEYSDALLAALEGTGSVNLPRQPRDMTGEQIIREIRRNPSRYFGAFEGREQTAAMINPDVGASELLRQSGIPGIRYLDQGSRDAGEGTSNFVVFPGNEDMLTILKRNDEPVGLLSSPVEKPIQSLLDTSYRMTHTAPNREFGATLDDLTGGGQMYPSDVYSPKGYQYYGTGNSFDKKAFDIANRFKGKPDATVEIYRAVPKGVSDEINPGDWVTLTKDYAQEHGQGPLKGDYKIIKKKVKASDIYTNADSIHEWGYDPQ